MLWRTLWPPCREVLGGSSEGSGLPPGRRGCSPRWLPQQPRGPAVWQRTAALGPVGTAHFCQPHSPRLPFPAGFAPVPSGRSVTLPCLPFAPQKRGHFTAQVNPILVLVFDTDLGLETSAAHGLPTPSRLCCQSRVVTDRVKGQEGTARLVTGSYSQSGPSQW